MDFIISIFLMSLSFWFDFAIFISILVKKIAFCRYSVFSIASLSNLSYGRFDHEDWCTHKTSLCTWNLERRNLDENKPDTVLEVSSCLMCTAFHPSNPALIAGGTYNGEGWTCVTLQISVISMSEKNCVNYA